MVEAEVFPEKGRQNILVLKSQWFKILQINHGFSCYLIHLCAIAYEILMSNAVGDKCLFEFFRNPCLFCLICPIFQKKFTLYTKHLRVENVLNTDLGILK